MIRDLQFVQPAGATISLRMNLDLSHNSNYAINWYIENRAMPEPEVVNLLLRAIRPGDFVVDGGANVGLFTLLMSNLAGPKGRVIAVEPGSNNLPFLNQNIGLNKLDNIQIIEKPLSDKLETVTFYEKADGGENSISNHDEGRAVVMQTTTLNDICSTVAKGPRLIKLDIEGAELRALSGADAVLTCLDAPLIVCEINAEALERLDASIDDLRVFMGQYAECFALHPDGSLPSLIPFGSTIKTNRANTNVLFASIKQVSDLYPEVDLP